VGCHLEHTLGRSGRLSTVGDLETGTRQPDMRSIHKLTRALGVGFWALYEEPGTVLPGAVTLRAELYAVAQAGAKPPSG
jgi:transcriptional regulator with XRE-family HTH domain